MKRDFQENTAFTELSYKYSLEKNDGNVDSSGLSSIECDIIEK